MVLTEKDKRDFILLNKDLFAALWIKGYKSDEAKQVEQYFKKRQIISPNYVRADLIRRFMKTYQHMLDAKEIEKPEIIQLSDNYKEGIISPPDKQEKLVVFKSHDTSQIRKSYEQAFEFMKEHYFKRNDL